MSKHSVPSIRAGKIAARAQAIEATGDLADAQLSVFTRDATLDTVMGKVRFGKNGEWPRPQVVQIQYQGIETHDAGQFKERSRQVVVAPSDMGHALKSNVVALSFLVHGG